ncbi:hypothetical protein [Roseateles oligotrophus]|uniref:DUF4124 domain-containing protein n=1 Tax=Roseateles oligotrophus TaxID=1769250 RepID=A0ABT2YBV1_9BURK|nr:hypothetical protein [Roseateles oligotrophus]MCV2366560.1 hypothetical protein [Roseateles oligotrophus]
MKLAPWFFLPVLITTYVDAALAQTKTQTISIYRCGADGRDLRDSPCPAHLPASDSQLIFDQPSAGQAQASKEIAAADAKRADAMQKARLKQEAEARHLNGKVAGIDGLKTSGQAASAPTAKPPVTTQSPKPPKPPKPPKSPKHPKAAEPSAAPG